MSTAAKKVLRVWHETRTSHFELLKRLTPSTLFYASENYSFDIREATGLDVRKRGIFATTWAVLTGTHQYVEFNEPTMLKLWPRLLIYTSAHRARRAFDRKGSPSAILYAIDNLPPDAAIADTFRLPRRFAAFLVRPFFRYMFASFDRVSFGSAGAAAAYASLLRTTKTTPEISVIPQLPSPCSCPDAIAAPRSVLFVGALEHRKGIVELMKAWELMDDDTRLTIVGIGPLTSRVQAWANAKPNVRILIDPPRDQVHQEYRRAEVVVLLSKRVPRWREQVGLPIVEGLSHGCVVVTTSETGIADWLQAEGHFLVDAANPAHVVDAVNSALQCGPARIEVLGSLPTEHTRVTSDRWLTR
ncbi:glycosyltransferase family 4 protein [Microbacterium sp. Leaf288]|uniref:glycosyltransferase family 4 protein n=1 Tax=Microbacterium sp. Leaf288 TaxID=1736323 RepID=UPI000A42FC13|nr:glycosyltransferase [Microbacterium sp. Leaf288]